MRLGLLVLLTVLGGVGGNVFITQGMRETGPVEGWDPVALLKTAAERLHNQSVLWGIACLTVSFFSYLFALGMADVSFVVPLTASEYILATVAARYWLGEQVSLRRWMGASLVAAGVLVTSLSEAGPLGEAPRIMAGVSANGIAFGLFGLLTTSATLYYALVLAGLAHFQRTRSVDETARCPTVSILKPLCSAQPHTKECLRSFCEQDYEDYEILLGIEDPRDPVVSIARAVAREFPRRRVQVIVATAAGSGNRKVSLLKALYRKSEGEVVILSDGDIRVGRDYLKRVIAPLDDPAVGMVTCPYRSVEPANFLARLDALGCSAELFPGVLSARLLEGMSFGFGSTIALRRSCFERVGAFREVEDYLGDDYRIGFLISKAGWKVILSSYVVEHVLGLETFRDSVHRLVRSARNTRVCRPASYLGLVLTHGTVASVPFLMLSGGVFWPWLVALSCWSLRYVSAFAVGRWLLSDSAVLRHFWLLPFRDLLSVVAWVCGLAGNRIVWRGHLYRLTREGRLLTS